eukprot:1488835-Amphidinium_carterae.1
MELRAYIPPLSRTSRLSIASHLAMNNFGGNPFQAQSAWPAQGATQRNVANANHRANSRPSHRVQANASPADRSNAA